ncbi:hypothetical protein ACIOWG_18110 [Streptomyces sp. NPDC087658]|uniref:GH12 family glycosyl hydrolase domain-containing protein n=1 Tax=Streptomyces sp. NPDC087658 TaxID=3365800 RepID=UPI003817CC0A
MKTRAGRKVASDWTFKITQATPSVMNVSYDVRFHAKSNPDWADQLTGEIMVWLNHQGGAGPLGAKTVRLTVGGVAWDLYAGKIVNRDGGGRVTSGWNVYAYVRASPVTSAHTDITQLAQRLVGRGRLQNTKYLTSVEIRYGGVHRQGTAGHQRVLPVGALTDRLTRP